MLPLGTFRPPHETEGFAVIMTRKSQIFRYQGLLNGSEPVESTLHTALDEHMNSEMVLGTITDLPSAIAWLKMSYLYVTTCFHMLVPQHFDMQPGDS